MRKTLPLIALSLWASPLQAQSFVKDVAPIFEKSCASCHASQVKMGGLDLETWEGIKTGGADGPIITPGKSDESSLYLRIAGKKKPAMPMGGEKLSDGEVALIAKWIDSGAKGPAPGEVMPKTAGNKLPSVPPKVLVKPQIFSMAYRPDGKLIALGGFKEVRLIDASTGKLTGTLPGEVETVRAVAFSHDGHLLAAAGGLPARSGQIKIWDVDKRTELKTIQGHADCIYAVAFSPDGKAVATSSYDKLIKLWDIDTGKEIRTLKDHIDAVYALEFTPDGKRLVSGGADRTVKIWNVATGERLYTFGEPADGINTVAIDPSGNYVAAGGADKTIRIWELGEKSGKLLKSLIAHEDQILKLAYSPDGKTLISGSADRTIKVFKADDLTEIKAIPHQSDWIYGLEFAPDGKTFAAGRMDGSVSIYDTQKFQDTIETRRASR
jgi:WD40 repeat protein